MSKRRAQRRSLAAVLPVVVFAALAAAPSSAPTATTAVVRQASGSVRMLYGEAPGTHAVEVKAGDLPDSGATFATGAEGALTLRFHPDMTLVELPAASRATVGFSRADSGGPRRVVVHEGRAQSRVAPGGTVAFEDAHAVTTVRAGRVAYATGADAAVVLVLDGEAVLVNRKTGATDVVGAGGKAVANASGTIVTRAEARELAGAGLRQNVLEVDFWNPATEDYGTLEIEYEARPRAP